MSVLDALEKLKAAQLFDEDGEAVKVVAEPGLSEAEIVQLEEKLGAPLPDDYRLLVAHVGELFGPAPEIDFTGRLFDCGPDWLFPHGLAFASDGCGNSWVADLQTKRASETTILFSCHDAPVILF